jgi:hypothetical protein
MSPAVLEFTSQKNGFRPISVAASPRPRAAERNELPPVPRMLPAGDRAMMASSGGVVMLVFVADGQACSVSRSRFDQGVADPGRAGKTVGLGIPL